ncbi:MAG: YfhO family protein [Lactobacillaceae bacterium]|nr:YfhO family protein [Lactobacillaceae bacterium]
MNKINLNPLRWKTSTYALWVSFLLPIAIMLSYFAYRGMAPFGSSSILTVDLGQQYVDFFAGFKHTLLHQPTTLIYDFAKGLGGETYGDWAYYLLSPFNFLLLPFSNANLPIGILFVTVLKYGFAGWSMAWALREMHWQTGWNLPVFAVSYAFMGWFVANDLNLLWLDAAILLPLIIVGLERYLDGRSHWRFIWALTAIFIVNYYMAYMIGIFLVLYVIWRLFWQPYSVMERLLILGKFSFGAIMSIGLSTVVWLPTAVTLMNSKGQHMLENVQNHFEYMPADLLGKLFLGSFNFEQMQSGIPNIFVGSFALIVFWIFMTYKAIRWQTRLVAFLITAFLVVSMMYAPLDVAWHGFQFPVWYPYRFSFVFSFWLIWIAGSIWTPDLHLGWRQLAGIVVLLGGTVGFLVWRMGKLNFLTNTQLIIGVAFFAAILFLMQIPWRGKWWLPTLLILVVGEMTASTIWTLNNFSYLTQIEYSRLITSLQDSTRQLPKSDKDFYRVAQSFQRTKGDPLQGDYYGASTFSSALEHQQSDFMATIGQPEGDNYITYKSGTLISDSLLGMRYLIAPNGADATADGTPTNMQTFPRLDTDDIYTGKTFGIGTEITKNNQALPVAFAANTAALNINLRLNDPITNQNTIWQSLLGVQDQAPIKAIDFTKITGANVNVPAVVTGSYIQREKGKKDGALTMHYHTTGKGPNYLSIGAGLAADDVDIYVNGQAWPAIPSHRHTILLPLPNASKDEDETVTFRLKKASVWLQDVTLYTLDTELYKQQAHDLQANPLKLTQAAPTKIIGNINIPKGSNLLMTTVPAAKGWELYVDGKLTDTVKVDKFFIGAVLSPGTHHVELRFTAPMLHEGLIATIGFILFLIGLGWSESSKRKHSLHV